MEVLTLRDVDFRYGGIAAVSGFSMRVEEGSITSLIGPNGAGKTTIFNLISGSLRPAAGTILFKGKPIHGLPSHRIAALGVGRTFQNIQLFRHHSVREHIDVAQYLGCGASFLSEILGLGASVADGIRRDGKTREVLDFLGLTEFADVLAVDLPYGLQRRLEFGRALAMGASLLLLDEPTAGMNIGETEEMTRLIRKVAASGVTVLLVEHDMRVVMNISDRVWVMNYGSVLASGTPEDVRRNRDVIAAYLGEAEAV